MSQHGLVRYTDGSVIETDISAAIFALVRTTTAAILFESSRALFILIDIGTADAACAVIETHVPAAICPL
jgi:hypothetical protein